MHLAYFWRGLSLISEWQYGYGNYRNPNLDSLVEVPFQGFYVAAGYFLTGGHVERRTRVRPFRSVFPVNPNEPCGFGAWELAGRVGHLRLGDEVFQGGLADPALWSNSVYTTELGVNWYLNEYLKISIWSNSVYTTELGVNWYLNEYLKISMFWLHGDFGDPVHFWRGGFQNPADMFWLRSQLFF